MDGPSQLVHSSSPSELDRQRHGGARNRLRPRPGRINFSELTRETAGSENKELGVEQWAGEPADFSARLFHLRYSSISPCRTGVEENFSVSQGFGGKTRSEIKWLLLIRFRPVWRT